MSLAAEIPITELTAGLASLMDGILAAVDSEQVAAPDKSGIAVELLRMVRDRFEAMRVAASEGQCSADDFEAGMNAMMAELRSQ